MMAAERYSYPRDFRGYGRHLPKAPWPNNARLALCFVINYEEGAEYSLLDGACRISPLVKRAVELKFPAMAVTDHGNLFFAM